MNELIGSKRESRERNLESPDLEIIENDNEVIDLVDDFIADTTDQEDRRQLPEEPISISETTINTAQGITNNF